ncbi:MAG TPA: PDZ domain-containing protein [Burkholderiaceae bacterium]|nr:PDZ domain-containing protein [Burkholderiaceae bacterium]
MPRYRIEPADRHSHHFHVTLTLPHPAGEQGLSLPVWIPGSYLVREFPRHLSQLRARQGTREVPLRQIDKSHWVAQCRGGAALHVSYRVYAFDTSVRACYLDARRGFFNGTSLCLCAAGREAEAHRVEMAGLPRGWQIATAMPRVRGAANAFEAADYDELVDHPFELGAFWRGRFQAGGVPHDVVVAGAYEGFDGERLLADARRICDAQIGFWRGRGSAGPPFAQYLFALNTVEDGRGGLEHRASTALLAPRRSLPRPGMGGPHEAYVDLLGLISHEYFHAWNVKRLKPAEFARLEYARENYTQLLWFFEGFTSYYDDLMVLRAGLIDTGGYLGLLAKTINAVRATPGRRVHSLAQASFEAWTKFYRSDENTPNITVSYYAKGALTALALDLSLRQAGRSLDAVMRALWRGSRGGPIDEARILQAVESAGGRALARELHHWVHATAELPLQRLLEGAAVSVRDEPTPLASGLGLRLSEGPLTGVQVKSVLVDSAAARAGISTGDELLAVDGWRIRRLDEMLQWSERDRPFQVLLARDRRMHTLRVEPDVRSPLRRQWRLALDDGAAPPALARRRAWLGR